MSIESTVLPAEYYSVQRLHRLVKPYFFGLGLKSFRNAIAGKQWQGVNVKCPYIQDKRKGHNATIRIKGEDFLKFFEKLKNELY